MIGYLEKGVVGEDDSYVIAVNGRLLRRNGFPQLFGISQFPFAVEAVFPVGPIQVSIDLRTNEISGSAYQHRPFVINKNGSSVPTSIFLDPAYRKISAIWAMDIDECEVIGNTQYLEVVHNPNATQPIPSRLLPASAEYVASRSQEEDQYILERQDRGVEN